MVTNEIIIREYTSLYEDIKYLNLVVIHYNFNYVMNIKIISRYFQHL